MSFKCMSDIHNDYLLNTAWACDINRGKIVEQGKEVLNQAKQVCEISNYSSHSGSLNHSNIIMSILSQGYPRLACEVAVQILGKESLPMLRNIYVTRSPSMRILLYICRLETYARIEEIANPESQSKTKSNSQISFNSGCFIARKLQEEVPKEIHLTPFHSVSCGHANTYLHILAYQTYIGNESCRIKIWSSPRFSSNSVIENILCIDNNIDLIEYEYQQENINLLAEAYQNDSWFNIMNIDNMYNLHQWYDESVWNCVRGNFKHLMTKYLDKILKEKNVSQELSEINNSSRILVPIHVRTPYFKGSQTVYDRLRDADPITYRGIVKKLASENQESIFFAAGSWPYRELSSCVVKRPEDILKQLVIMLKASMMITCSSGISHLAILSSSRILHINSTCFVPNDYISAESMFCMKKVIPKGELVKSLPEKCLGDLLLSNWTSDAFSHYFLIEDLNGEEIEKAYSDFKELLTAQNRWRYKLATAVSFISSEIGARCPNINISKLTYSNIISIAEWYKQ